MKKKHSNRMRGLGSGMLAMITFMIFAPFSAMAAGIFALGIMAMPFMPMEKGVLGLTAAEEQKAAEDAFFLKAKEKTEGFMLEFVKNNETIKALMLIPDQVKKLETDIAAAKTPEELTALKAKMDELGVKLVGLTEAGGAPKKAKSWEDEFTAQWKAKEAEIKSIIDTQGKQPGGPLVFNLKSAIVMGDNTTIDTGDTNYSLASATNIISTIRRRVTTWFSNVSMGRMTGNTAWWIEEEDQQGTPIMIAEATTKTQLSVKYVEKSTQAKKIGVYGKVTTELMSDLPQLISYIQTNLMKRMDIVVEDQLIDGDGTGDNLQGAMGVATAFSAGALANTVLNAGITDVIRAVAYQTEIGFGQPNVIYVHPSKIAGMDLEKTNQGLYVRPSWATDNNIAGMRVIATTALGVDEFLGGDFSVIHTLIREDSSIQIGLDGNDFTQNKKTILIEQRLAQFVSANDVQVLITGLFSTAITALQANT